MKKTVAYGKWTSHLDMDVLFSKPSTPAYPFMHKKHLCFLQSLPEQGGRTALHMMQDGTSVCVTPAPFNIRTRVHEYGGCCFAVNGSTVWFNNYADGGLYSQHLDNGAEPVLLWKCADNKYEGFADLVVSPDGSWLFAVCEKRLDGSAQNQNQIVGFNLRSSDPSKILECATGADFYGGLCMDQRGQQVAWFEWDNPYMPWDESRLMSAKVDLSDQCAPISDVKTVFEQADNAVCQPGFMPNGDLVFASEHGDQYWNLYRLEYGAKKPFPIVLTHGRQEFGEAHWVFGQKRWQAIGDGRLVAVATTRKGDCLMLVEWNQVSASIKPISDTQSVYSQFWANRDSVLFITAYADRPAEIQSLVKQTLSILPLWQAEPDGAVKTPAFQTPSAIAYPTADGKLAHGYFYAPLSGEFAGPKDKRPPLMVFVHGGPTSRSTSELHLLKQYFVSIGFAVLDVNHRGSTGYGRAYRQALIGRWGELDASDIVDGLAYVIAQGWIDETKACIRGGSAGGFAVLSALTQYPQHFCVGACYYGIGNLITLAEITHKFEGKYTDRLVGEEFDSRESRQPDSLFVTRSPIFQMEKLRSPVILFQGLDDKVVPPAVSREVVELLKKNKLLHEYHEYKNEGHGFRRSETRIDSLKREVRFLNEVLNPELPNT